jgi:PST family polysaccharide transporter
MPPLSSLRELNARPAAQAIKANLGWLALDKGLRLVLGLTVGTWVARYLGPADYGLLNYALALASLLAVLPGLGLDGLVRRELVSETAPAPTLLGTVTVLRLAVGLVVYAALASGALLFGHDARLQQVMLYSGLLLFQPMLLTPDLWFQARMLSKHTVIAQNTAFVLSSLGRVALILGHAPLPWFAALIIIDLGVTSVLLARTAARLGCPWRGWRWDSTLARDLFSRAWPLLLSGLAVIIYLKIDQVMVKLLAGATAAGHYAAAVKISEICYLGPVILASALFPAIVRAKAGHPERYTRRIRQYFNLSAGLAYLAAVPIAFAAPAIIRLLYGAAYAPSGPVLAVHLWTLVFVAQGVARQEWLLGEGLMRFSLAATASGAALNVALNFWLIPRQGALGAAVATVIALAVSDVLSSLLWRRTREAGWWQLRALFGWWKLPPEPS